MHYIMPFWLKTKQQYSKLCVRKYTDKNLERWETNLLTVFKPMVIESGKWLKWELTFFTLYILLQI